ncbi:PKS-NRPS hybrid synthetase [Tanacetum coccineum]
MSGHPSFRQLPEEDVETVKNMTLSGIPPRQIISSLRQKSQNLPINSQTIYNLKAKIRKDDLGNRSIVGALLEELQNGGFSHDVDHDSEGGITCLFIIHPLSLKLARMFSNVFVMDCTYKTNKYKMPLLDIIGVSCFNTSFYSGFVFLKKEDKDSYVWALTVFKKFLGQANQPAVIMSDRELALMNGISDVFPTATSLLCVWHIQKNMFLNCKKDFENADEFNTFMSWWNVVVYSTTELVFEENWGEFELCYRDKKHSVEYIKTNLLPWKKKFVSAWTEKHLHFRNRASSKELKIKVQLASERIQTPHECNMPLFRELLSHVSLFALKEIYKQYIKKKDGIVTMCTGHFLATMGLPCVHRINSLQGMALSLDLVHPHWRIDTLSLCQEDDSQNDIDDQFAKLITELQSKYQV